MRLIKPTIEYKEAYLEMLADWNATGEEYVPFSLRFETADFEAFIHRNELDEETPPEKFVTYTTYWLINEEEKIVATSNLRHYLNDGLRIIGGHIGYGVRPSFRRKGYATKILELTLLEAKKRNIHQVMVTCDKDNIGSAKTILKNGGVLAREIEHEGEIILNFWIENK